MMNEDVKIFDSSRINGGTVLFLSLDGEASLLKVRKIFSAVFLSGVSRISATLQNIRAVCQSILLTFVIRPKHPVHAMVGTFLHSSTYCSTIRWRRRRVYNKASERAPTAAMTTAKLLTTFNHCISSAICGQIR